MKDLPVYILRILQDEVITTASAAFLRGDEMISSERGKTPQY